MPVHEVPPPPQPPSLKTGARREDARESGVRRRLAGFITTRAGCFLFCQEKESLAERQRSLSHSLPADYPTINFARPSCHQSGHTSYTPPQRRRATLLLLAQVTGHFQPLTKPGTRKCLLQFIAALMKMRKKCCLNSNARDPKATK